MSDNPFLKALDVLERRGWFQGRYENRETGAVCALGALGVATTGMAPFYEDEHAAVLRVVVGDATEYVSRWNDAPERSYEDVVLAFKHAAEKWEADQ